MSFELSEFQFGTLKLTYNLSVHNPQVSIFYHNHFAIFTWFSTHIIVHRLKKAISVKEFSSSRFNFLFSQKTLQSNLSWLHNTFSSLATLKERLAKDRSSLRSVSKSEVFLEDLLIRHRLVKSPCLHLTFSSSSELEESPLEKLKLLKVAHAQDMIF
jgi:hypothetical protein